VTAVAKDAAGNTTTSAPITVTVSNTTGGGGGGGGGGGAPAVTLTAPPNGVWIGNSVKVSATASGAASITIYGNGGPVLKQTCAASPCTLETWWVTGALPDAAYQIQAVATSGSGATTTTPAVVVYKNTTSPVVASGAPGSGATSPPPSGGGGDTAAPAVSLTAPASGATVSGTVTLSATASDNVGVAGVQFKVDGANVGAEDTAAPYTTSWSSMSAANGTHTVTAVAKDAAGNTTTSAPITVTVSNTTGGGGGGGPAVTLTAPPNGVWIGNSVKVSATASGAASITIYGNGGPVLEQTCAASSCTLETWWVTGALPDAAYQIQAVATSSSGVSTTTPAVVVYKNTTSPVVASGAPGSGGGGTASPPPPTGGGNTTLPTVAITTPFDGDWTGNSIKVTASATASAGLASITLHGDGAQFGPTFACGGATSCSATDWWSTGALPPGTHTIHAVATDASGHEVTSATVTINK
jgi:hypothetical protein